MQKTTVPRRAVAEAPTARDWRPWLLLLALLLATLAAYHPAWHGGMVWDDDAHVTAPVLRSWPGLYRIWFDVRATLQYYPLLHTAFWIEHRLWGDATLWYHLINILEHVGVALMLALILRRLAIPGAYLAAAIFALHPVHVESVAWISEQKNTLSALFYLAGAMLYLRFDESRKTRWYAAAVAAFVLALLSKTVTATLPGALLVIFWWRRGRLSWKRDALPLVPFFIVGAGAATITAWWELAVNNCTGPDFQFTFVERLLIAGRAIWFQLGKLFWPTNLAFIYPRWTIDSGAWWQYLFPVGAIALAASLWAIRRWSRAPLAAFLFFCGTLFPVLGFFILYTFRYSFVANHYQYLASVGPIALTVSLLATAIDRIAAHRTTRGIRRTTRGIRLQPDSAHTTTRGIRLQPDSVLRGLVVAALVVLLAGVTRAETRKFDSLEALLQDTISKDGTSWFAYTNLGSLRLAQGRTGEARDCFEKALRLKPGFAVAYNDLGNTWLRDGDLENAMRNHRKAVDLQPDYAEAHNNLGIDLVKAGNYNDAIASYRRAIAVDPRYAMAHYNLANALVRVNDAAGAERHYRQAIALGHDFALAYYFLGLHLLSARREREAHDALDTAFRLKPDFAQGYYELGNVQLQQGSVADAVASYSRALSIKPDYAEAHGNLGSALMRLGRMDEAIAQYREALRVKPDYAIALNNLGFALERQGRAEEAAAQYRQALRLDPNNVKARENLDRVLAVRR
jgi:tetratricopeptide (TPR) repeat protein